MSIEIPDAAVEAAVSVIYDYDAGQHYSKEATATKLLEAAYPHLVAAAKREVLAELRERVAEERAEEQAREPKNQAQRREEATLDRMVSYIDDAERGLG